MADANQANLQQVDWSQLPSPLDDGGGAHLEGMALPDISLASTADSYVQLGSLKGTSVIFAYPMTGRPDVALPEGWDMIPGARGCTPQACTFRDLYKELQDAGANHVFGLSVQSTEYQKEAAERLHLPFALLSDCESKLRSDLKLPVMQVEEAILMKRLTMICVDGRIKKVFYPVYPPDRSATDVLDWLQQQ
ncbi:MAG: redoxin family protein [Rhizobiaceae bacterium]|nr:redoxin family protein [Rhizobiaceae bacterium]